MEKDNFLNKNQELKDRLKKVYRDIRFGCDYETWYKKAPNPDIKDSEDSWNIFIEEMATGSDNFELIYLKSGLKNTSEKEDEDISEYLSDLDDEFYEEAKDKFKKKFGKEYIIEDV